MTPAPDAARFAGAAPGNADSLEARIWAQVQQVCSPSRKGRLSTLVKVCRSQNPVQRSGGGWCSHTSASMAYLVAWPLFLHFVFATCAICMKCYCTCLPVCKINILCFVSSPPPVCGLVLANSQTCMQSCWCSMNMQGCCMCM